MLLKLRAGGAFERPVIDFQSLKSYSDIDESEQTTTIFLRSTSSAPLAEAHTGGGGVLVSGARCHLPNWYFQRSAYVVYGSMPPKSQTAFVFRSLRNTNCSRPGGGKFGSTICVQSPAE